DMPMGFWNRLFRQESKTSSLELFREIYGFPYRRHKSRGTVPVRKSSIPAGTVVSRSPSAYLLSGFPERLAAKGDGVLRHDRDGIEQRHDRVDFGITCRLL